MHSVQHMNDKLTSNADERICNIDESNQEVTGPDSKIDEASLDVEYTAQQNPVFIKSTATLNILRARSQQIPTSVSGASPRASEISTVIN